MMRVGSTKGISQFGYRYMQGMPLWRYLSFAILVLLPFCWGLSGPNVCTTRETYTTMVNISVEQAVRVRTVQHCLSIPPICSVYKIVYRPVYKQQTRTKVRAKQICCSGYTAVNGSDTCQAVCAQQCIHGVCLKPELCRCDAGYSGGSCNLTCPEGKWGAGCLDDCLCEHEGKCDPVTGMCTCHAGWIGLKCENKCSQGKQGMDCTDSCRCENGGSCSCPAGWTGPLCEESCPEGTHGSVCSNTCQCQHGGSCDAITGKCTCPSGLTVSSRTLARLIQRRIVVSEVAEAHHPNEVCLDFLQFGR